ncbi:MAG: IMP dehydrogenase [Gammaproteobacteria bacterium]|nr:IMP dehydrogenase [Gammaproteobacteria bacterium]
MTDTPLEAGWTGMTFDDFLMRPHRGVTTSRREISLRSPLTATLDLELPIVSSNMDSVTGEHMAEAMALEGGIGVIHRGQSIERQAAKVAEVKRSYSAVIENPHRMPLGATLGDAVRFARRHKVTGILIETRAGSGILAGLLSSRDIPWTGEWQDQLVDEFMTPVERLHTHAPGISVEEAERILFDRRIERLPLGSTATIASMD